MEQGIKNLSEVLTDGIRIKGITVEKLAQLSGVSERYIASLVEEKYSELPAAPYVRGYLLKIAALLNLDGENIWQEYLKNHDALRRAGERDHLPPNRFTTKNLGKKPILVGFIAIFLVGFFVSRIAAFYSGPSLTLANLKENIVVESPQFVIEGKIKLSDQLTLNGEEIYPDEKGNFEKTVELGPGFNTLIFKVKKLLGKEHTIIKQIFYRQETINPTTQ